MGASTKLITALATRELDIEAQTAKVYGVRNVKGDTRYSKSGIGFELVRLLAQRGHTVYIGARNPVSGNEALEKLYTDGLTTVKFVLLDVTDALTIENAAKTIESAEGRLDVLVNNAAIANIHINQHASNVGLPVLRDVMETNFFGLVKTTTSFMPLLRKSSQAVILNVSSALGSNTLQSKPGSRFDVAAYCASKAAINSYTISLARDLRDEGIKVNTCTPGYVSSKINHFGDGGKTLKEGALAILPLTLFDKDGPTGKFFDWEGNELPW